MTIGGTGTSSTVGALVIDSTGTSTFGSIQLGSPTNYIRATSSGIINAPFTPNNNSVIFGASAGSDFIPFASLSNVFSGTGSVTYGGHSGDTGIVRADVRHTYTGNTTLAYGTTYIDSTLELPATGGPLGNKSLTAANTLLMTGGTLFYANGSYDYSGRFSTTGSQQWKIDTGASAVTFATNLVGASSLSLLGGALTLTGSSTFSSGVTLASGTLYAGAAQSGVSGPLGITGTITFSPAGTGVLGYTAASAAFDYSSRFATTSGQSRRINANGESVTFSTAMGGDNELRLVGSAGTLTLAVANTYTQGTTLSVGTLKCGNAASLGTGGLAQANGTTLHVTATGGKLTIQGAHTNTGTGNRTIRIGA
jgi:autotransporter-associated beta strand protein